MISKHVDPVATLYAAVRLALCTYIVYLFLISTESLLLHCL